MKFDRKCELSIEVLKGKDETLNLVIPPEFTIDFEVTRANLASTQTATFKVYNLGEKTRRLIYADPQDTANNMYRAIQFKAGYEGVMPMIFNGQMKSALSQRNGVDGVTEIEAWGGAVSMASGHTSMVIAAGESAGDVLAKLARSLPLVDGTPIIGDFNKSNPRARTIVGNTWNVICDVAKDEGGLAYIDNGQVKILKPEEAIFGDIPVITSESGLLTTPQRRGAFIEFDMLFEPRIELGQFVQLDSRFNKEYNGTYKVCGFRHSGTISPVKGGKCTTSVTLYVGKDITRIIKGASLNVISPEEAAAEAEKRK